MKDSKKSNNYLTSQSVTVKMRCLKMFDWHLPVQPHITYSLEKKLVYREKWKVLRSVWQQHITWYKLYTWTQCIGSFTGCGTVETFADETVWAQYACKWVRDGHFGDCSLTFRSDPPLFCEEQQEREKREQSNNSDVNAKQQLRAWIIKLFWVSV